MGRDPHAPELAEHERVSVRSARDLRRWCARLGCTQTQLQTALRAVGADADDVQEFATADD
jgi:hypothetical protein